jgi:hypothetical protein
MHSPTNIWTDPIYGLIPDPINRQEVERRIDFEDLYFNEIVVGGGSNLLTT